METARSWRRGQRGDAAAPQPQSAVVLGVLRPPRTAPEARGCRRGLGWELGLGSSLFCPQGPSGRVWVQQGLFAAPRARQGPGHAPAAGSEG